MHIREVFVFGSGDKLKSWRLGALAALPLAALLAAGFAYGAFVEASGSEPEASPRESVPREEAPREEAPQEGFSVPDPSQNPQAEDEAKGEDEGERDGGESGDEAASVPQNTTLRLTIPRMERGEDAEAPNAKYDDERSLRQNTAIHLSGTGFPWQEEANVYISGHRLGYPATDSFLAFYDLDKLENGDEITVTDANGAEYTYEVFDEVIAHPTEDLHLLETVPGKNILTLQTCTLPDYSERIIIRAELKE